MKRSVLLVLMVFVLLSTCVSSASGETRTIRVLLDVTGDQKWEAEDFMKAALGSLGDVEVVDSEPNLYVQVMARRLVTNKGKSLGYVMSSASAQMWEVSLEGGFPYRFKDYNGLWLEVGPNMRSLSIQCVIALNEGVLSKMRESLRDTQYEDQEDVEGTTAYTTDEDPYLADL